MPAFFSHYRFGFYSYKEMPDTIIKRSVRNHPHVFSIGCQGPDLFFYHFGSCINVKNNYANRLHEEKTGELIHCLIKKALSGKFKNETADTNTQIQIAYAAGFMAHYCLDCKIHPYIYSMVGTDKGMYYTGKHFEFESDIDLQFLKKIDNKRPVYYNAPMIVSLTRRETEAISHQLSYCITQTFNDAPLSEFKCTAILKEMKIILTLLRDKKGYKGKWGGYAEDKALGYRVSSPLFYNNLSHGSTDACNEAKQLWLNPFSNELSDKSFFELFDEAKKEYLHLIGLFEASIKDKKYLQDILSELGNRSYKTGMQI